VLQTVGPFDPCPQVLHDGFHHQLDAQATLGSLRRNRMGESGQASLTALCMTPDDRLTLYMGANSYLNTDDHWQEPQVLAGLKLQIPLSAHIGLRNETEARRNLTRLPLSYVERQNYLTTKTGLIVKFNEMTALEASYTFKFSNDYIPDGETNYAQTDPYGAPRVVHTEAIALTAKRRMGPYTVKGHLQFEPDLKTPTSPGSGVDWLGAGLGLEWSPHVHRSLTRPAAPWQLKADVQYTQPPGIRNGPGINASLSARYSF